MIQFEDMVGRLASIGKNRAWLAEETPYSADYIRTVLAPKSTRRTERVQKVLSDAILREEERQRAAAIVIPPLLDRITIECHPEERRRWNNAAMVAGQDLDAWVIESLNSAAEDGSAADKANGTNG